MSELKRLKKERDSINNRIHGIEVSRRVNDFKEKIGKCYKYECELYLIYMRITGLSDSGNPIATELVLGDKGNIEIRYDREEFAMSHFQEITLIKFTEAVEALVVRLREIGQQEKAVA